MIHITMFINRRLDIGSLGWWLTTTKGLLGIRCGGYLILGTLSNIVALLSILETNTTWIERNLSTGLSNKIPRRKIGLRWTIYGGWWSRSTYSMTDITEGNPYTSFSRNWARRLCKLTITLARLSYNSF